MKFTAPFTHTEVAEIKRSEKLPLCKYRADVRHTTNRPPWYTNGAMQVTQVGLICPVCGYTIESVTTKGSPSPQSPPPPPSGTSSTSPASATS